MARWCPKSLSIQCTHPPQHGHTKVTIIVMNDPLTSCFIPCQSTHPFLRQDYFKLWPWKFKAKVMGMFKGLAYIVGPVSNWFDSFSFQFNQIKRPRSWVCLKGKPTWLHLKFNKANLRDLIAATGLVILLKLDSIGRFFSRETPNLGQNRRFFEPSDLEIWRMTFKNNRAPLLCYFKLCAAFHSHWWIHTGVTVRKRPI